MVLSRKRVSSLLSFITHITRFIKLTLRKLFFIDHQMLQYILGRVSQSIMPQKKLIYRFQWLVINDYTIWINIIFNCIYIWIYIVLNTSTNYLFQSNKYKFPTTFPCPTVWSVRRSWKQQWSGKKTTFTLFCLANLFTKIKWCVKSGVYKVLCRVIVGDNLIEPMRPTQWNH